MAQHLLMLVDDLVGDPARRVAALNMLGTDERELLLETWNDTAVAYPQESIPALIAGVAKQTPDAPAIVAGGTSMSYAALDAGANRIAHFLRAQGVGSGSVVGVLVPSSAALYRAALGIMRSGAAYLPMDPATPASRVQLLMTEAGAVHLLTDAAGDTLDHTGAGSAISILRLDSPDWSTYPDAAPEVTLRPEDPAYVIFTSGSTGRPKGVAVPHRALTNLCAWHRRVYAVGPDDRASQVASPAFDASVWETWPYLRAGASIHIPDADLRVSPAGLMQWLADQAITYAFMPTPLAELALENAPPQGLCLRALLVGGAKLHRPPQAGLPFAVINHYGPTEYGVVATAGPVPPDCVASPPIGRPIDNTRAYILDSLLQPVPIGVAGELFLAGDGLAIGYLGRPEATARRFVDCPFSDDNCMYRTGDRVKYLASGDIAFLERVDDQLKIRGFRVEPGEIESALTLHPSVEEAAVVAVGDGVQDRLAAFVVRREHAENARESGERVAMWRTLYDQTFAEPVEAGDAADFTGWNDSCTQRPIASEQMDEWVAQTLRRIPTGAGSRVLEIGCGTGLLSLQVAGSVAAYHGTDFSAPVLERIRRRAQAAGLCNLVLEQREANDFEGIPPASYDTIVLNSIVQYFPSVDYLLQVLDGVVAAAAPGATLFIGDVRSFPLLEGFHTFVQLARAGDDTPVAELRSRIATAMALEQELLLDPRLFFALATRQQRDMRVRVLPKQGHQLSEMLRFRYDVLITLDQAADHAPAQSLDWRRERLDRAALRAVLLDEQPASLLVTGIPNARTEPISRVVDRLVQQPPPDIVELRTTVQAAQGIDPSDWSAFDIPGYALETSWFDMDVRGAYALVFRRLDAAPLAPQPTLTAESKPDWRRYANDPLSGVAAQTLIPELKRHLAQSLPDYMVPASFTLLGRLPHTLSGKVDRRALSAAHYQRVTDERFVPPQDVVEEVLAEIWRRLLNLDRVGARDNFFSLGGHSLLATRVVSHVSDALGVEVPVRALFSDPTVVGLAQVIRSIEGDHARLRDDADLWLKVSSMPEAEAAELLAARERP